METKSNTVTELRPGLWLLAAVLVFSASARALRADNLVANGDFSQPLETGWNVNSTADQPAVELVNGEPGTARVSHLANGFTSLYQRIPVTSGNLKLAFSGRFSASVNKPNFGSMAALTLSYFDADSGLLGRTAFARIKGKSPLAGQANLHVIAVKADTQWSAYTLDVTRELKGNFPGVEPDDVRYVEIALSADNGVDPGC